MKIDAGQTINTLANVGVIVGIVFLAVEFGQNNDILESQRLATLATLSGSGYTILLERPELAPLLLRDRAGETLSTEERLIVNAFWMRITLDMESSFLQDPDFTERKMFFLQRIYASYPTFRNVWAGTDSASVTLGQAAFDPRFVEFANSYFRQAE